MCLGEGGSVRGSTNVIAALGDKDVCALAGHRLSMLLLEPIETEDFAKRVHRFLVRDFPEVFALHLFVLIEELLFCFVANQRFAFARRGFGDCGAWAESLHIT